MLKNYDAVLTELVETMAMLDAENLPWEVGVFLWTDSGGMGFLEQEYNPGHRRNRGEGRVCVYRRCRELYNEPEWPDGMTTEDKARELLEAFRDEYSMRAAACLEEAGKLHEAALEQAGRES